ncbi:hydroxylysine kinase-like isoform X2 [Dendronephthya gigantea]|uniref:hydroxylysine kinase-like isoform X2 n=1 Tax=Dendronephthya gigantea TaxID=151771 RepID=UPI0010692081|nr:hydroxylysine kinase-like isoform X2 [Dendronephthya gigantea]
MTTSMAMERPRVTQVKAIQLANEIFGLEVDLNSKKSAKELDSYDDKNFYLSGVKDGKPDAGIACPVPQKTLAGNYLEVRNLPSTPSNDQAKRIKLDDNLRPCIVCLFTFLPGKTMQDFKKNGHTFKYQFFLQLGQAVGNVANALKDLNCPVLTKREYRWDLYYFDTMLSGLDFISSKQKELVKDVENLFKRFVKPRLDVLPKQCIHGDITCGNVIIRKNPDSEKLEVSGFIDFGDVNYSCRVFEIAIAAAYMMNVAEDDIIKVGAYTVAGFHEICPLSQEESDVIFYCIQARLCMSGCFGAESCETHPDNAEYFLCDARRVWRVLEALASIDKHKFDKMWRELYNSVQKKQF